MKRFGSTEPISTRPRANLSFYGCELEVIGEGRASDSRSMLLGRGKSGTTPRAVLLLGVSAMGQRLLPGI